MDKSSIVYLITNNVFTKVMTNVDATYRRIKNWLIDSNGFTVQELQDKDSYFIFLINRIDRESHTVPITLSFPKYLINNMECVLLILQWDIHTKSGMMSAILNDPQMTSQFIVNLKKKLDLTKYKLEILPNEQDIKSIKIFKIMPVITLQREYLIDEIINLWTQYDRYLLAVNICFGMSSLTGPEDYR